MFAKLNCECRRTVIHFLNHPVACEESLMIEVARQTRGTRAPSRENSGQKFRIEGNSQSVDSIKRSRQAIKRPVDNYDGGIEYWSDDRFRSVDESSAVPVVRSLWSKHLFLLAQSGQLALLKV